MSAKHKLLPLRGWTPRVFGESTRFWGRSDRVRCDTAGQVVQWFDGGPHGNHAIQATPARRPPCLLTGGPNGRPALSFDASNRGLVIPGFVVTSNNVTAVAVLDQTAFKGVGSQFLLQQGGIGYQLEQSGAATVGITDPAARTVGAAQLGPQILELRLDSSALTVEGFRDGVSFGSDTYDGTDGFNGTTGLGANSGSTGSFCRMLLSELIVLDRLLTAGETTALYSYLRLLYRLG